MGAVVSVGVSAEQEQAILRARAKTNWGPMRRTWLTGRHRSTRWKMLKRHGAVAPAAHGVPADHPPLPVARGCALLHIDAFELAMFDRAGHSAHGDCGERHRTRNARKVKLTGVIDDQTRLADCELHSAENADTVSATPRRAAAVDARAGLPPPGPSCPTTRSATRASTASVARSTSSAPATS